MEEEGEDQEEEEEEGMAPQQRGQRKMSLLPTQHTRIGESPGKRRE